MILRSCVELLDNCDDILGDPKFGHAMIKFGTVSEVESFRKIKGKTQGSCLTP